METILAVVAFVLIAAGISAAIIIDVMKRSRLQQLAQDDPQVREELRQSAAEEEWGPLNSQLVCPHCQVRGTVRTKMVREKKGVSGAKATGAVLTAGLSVLATGLSRHETATQAHCDNCTSTWVF